MPNQGVPVIFKNKIAYGYAEKSVQAYDVSVSDYNALTEQQQLDGSIRFIQGVDAIPNGSNVWAKLGTTPLAEGLPRDCSQAVNELKSNLIEFKTLTGTTDGSGNLLVATTDIDPTTHMLLMALPQRDTGYETGFYTCKIGTNQSKANYTIMCINDTTNTRVTNKLVKVIGAYVKL